MTYSRRRQPRTAPRITALDVLVLVGLVCFGAWLLYQISAAILLLITYAGASR